MLRLIVSVAMVMLVCSCANRAADQESTVFEGTISVIASDVELSETGTASFDTYTQPTSLPELKFQFTMVDNIVLPVQRQTIQTIHPDWEWLVMPGTITKQQSPASRLIEMPIALLERNQNCTHYGVLSIQANGGSLKNTAEISIKQETCAYFKFDLIAEARVVYQPHKVATASSTKQQHNTLQAHKLPVKPVSELFGTTPILAADQSPEQVTIAGLYYDGVHYMQPCQTRDGEYSFCEQLPIPSFSLAKSFVTGIGAMYISQQYALDLSDVYISDLIPECSRSQWRDVTLLHALNMRTGNYESAGTEVDESSARKVSEFFLPETHTDKIRYACSLPKNSAPGDTLVYHTSDSYLVATALQRLFRSLEGDHADFYRDGIVEQIWKALNLSPLSYESKRTNDEESQFWGGYGLTLTADDIVRISRFLTVQQGRINGKQVLDPELLKQALFNTQEFVFNEPTGERYRHSFWAHNASNALGCSNDLWIPYMSAFGGIGVVLLPNDMIYYFISDNHEYGFMQTVKRLHQFEPMCD